MIKHFIDLSDVNKKDLLKIINFAKKIKKNPQNYNQILKNKSLGAIFEKQSTRTRVSFFIGMKKIGGNVIELDKKEIGLGKRESYSDIIKTLSQYVDCLLIRNNDHKKIKSLSEMNIMPIINGLSDQSHPCQVLSDIFTIQENLGNIANKNICWIGDINNVLKSFIQASQIFNFKLLIASPKKILYQNDLLLNKFSSKNIIFSDDPKVSATNADCIMTDTWVSMGEKKLSSKKKLFKDFQVNDKIMKSANKRALFMHCLPAHRNNEVSSSVIDGKQSIIWQQAHNRMYVQQGILKYCIDKI